MGVPVQFSAAPLLRRGSRREVLYALRTLRTCIVASDCHDLDRRPPNLGPARHVLERKLGGEVFAGMEARAAELLQGAAALA